MVIDLEPDVCTTLEKIASEYSRYLYLLKYCIRQGMYSNVPEYFQIAETLKIKLDLSLHLIANNIDSASGKHLYVDFQRNELVIDD